MNDILLIGGTDTCYTENFARCAVVVLTFPELSFVESSVAETEIPAPYIAGKFYLRELKPICEAYKIVRRKPDVLLVDGHGSAHPERNGLAVHVGQKLRVPTIGCAKSRLVGVFREPHKEKGSCEELFMDNAEMSSAHASVIGYALRTRDSKKVIFVSVGSGIELNQAKEVVLKTCKRYRIPEPIRLAHIISKRLYD